MATSKYTSCRKPNATVLQLRQGGKETDPRFASTLTGQQALIEAATLARDYLHRVLPLIPLDDPLRDEIARQAS